MNYCEQNRVIKLHIKRPLGETTKKIVTIIGARPQFIKAGPVSNELKKIGIDEVIIHTGQHYDANMSDIFFKELGLPQPRYNLGVGSASHGKQTAAMLSSIEDVLLKEKPDAVLVYGDTNSTLAGGIAASKLNIRLIHVESGLRSFNMRMPEEINRILVDRISDILFCPTEESVKNLTYDGIDKGVYFVGDVMYDATLQYTSAAEEKSTIMTTLALEKKKYALATVHRQENTDNIERLTQIFAALEKIQMPVIVPLHPRTRKILQERHLLPQRETSQIQIIDPVGYMDMLVLEKHANVILTDSGGVQKEAFFFGTPCITLRDETEWVETVASGWNTLAGADEQKILSVMQQIHIPKTKPAFYGDGTAAKKIAALLEQKL